MAVFDQVRTLDKRRLINLLGRLDGKAAAKVLVVLQEMLVILALAAGQGAESERSLNMLILLRRVGQAVGIGDQFLITVSQINVRWVEVAIVNRSNEQSSIHQLQLGTTLEFAPAMKLTLTRIIDERLENAARLGFEVPRDIPLYRNEDSIG
jgi:sRNA-binding carbon storage regulator CsrA